MILPQVYTSRTLVYLIFGVQFRENVTTTYCGTMFLGLILTTRDPRHPHPPRGCDRAPGDPGFDSSSLVAPLVVVVVVARLPRLRATATRATSLVPLVVVVVVSVSAVSGVRVRVPGGRGCRGSRGWCAVEPGAGCRPSLWVLAVAVPAEPCWCWTCWCSPPCCCCCCCCYYDGGAGAGPP